MVQILACYLCFYTNCSLFMDRMESGEVSKHVKKERDQYPAFLTEQAWSIEDLLCLKELTNFLEDTAGNPERARLCVAHMVLSEIARDLISRSVVYLRYLRWDWGQKRFFMLHRWNCHIRLHAGKFNVKTCMIRQVSHSRQAPIFAALSMAWRRKNMLKILVGNYPEPKEHRNYHQLRVKFF